MDDDISGGLVEAGIVRRANRRRGFFKFGFMDFENSLHTRDKGWEEGGGESMESRNLAGCFHKNRHIHSCYLYIFLVQVPSVIIHKAVKNGLIVCVSQLAVIRSVYTYLLTYLLTSLL